MLMMANQQGYVRTIKRPNREPQRLAGVTLRVRGDHNATMTDEKGEFSLLLPGVEAGQPYIISMVMKSGYELREPEFKGRKQAYSTEVPLEILMVSQKDLLADRMAIEEKARENIEKHYQEKLAQLDEELAAARLTNEQYEQKVMELEEKYESFDMLLEQMTRRYAVTDYDQLDETTIRINQHIEMGELDEAEQIIKDKGSADQREAEVRNMAQENLRKEQNLKEEMERLAQAKALEQKKRKELGDDYYALYTIALERYQHDTAEYYIVRRAELDTNNVEYQIQAGQYLMIFKDAYDRALGYFERALRQALAQNGRDHIDAATALNEIGMARNYKGEFKVAEDYYLQAQAIREDIAGKESLLAAESLNNLGALYQKTKEFDRALTLLRQALVIREKECEAGDPKIAESCSNVGAVLFYQKKYTEAAPLFERAMQLYRSCYGNSDYHVGIALNNLGSLAFIGGNISAAETYFTEALTIFQKTLGKGHNRTKRVSANLTYLQKFKQ